MVNTQCSYSLGLFINFGWLFFLYLSSDHFNDVGHLATKLVNSVWLIVFSLYLYRGERGMRWPPVILYPAVWRSINAHNVLKHLFNRKDFSTVQGQRVWHQTFKRDRQEVYQVAYPCKMFDTVLWNIIAEFFQLLQSLSAFCTEFNYIYIKLIYN